MPGPPSSTGAESVIAVVPSSPRSSVAAGGRQVASMADSSDPDEVKQAARAASMADFRRAMPLEVPTHAFALPEGVDPGALMSFLGERFDVAADSADVGHLHGRRHRRPPPRRRGPRPGARGRTRRQPRSCCATEPGSPPVTGPAGRHRRWLVGHLPRGPPARPARRRSSRCGPCCRWPGSRSTSSRSRVLNADAKTVVRLRLATHAALDTGREPRPLTPRLEVAGVLGYPRPLARVVGGAHRRGRPRRAAVHAWPTRPWPRRVATRAASAPRSAVDARGPTIAPTRRRCGCSATSPAWSRPTCPARWPTTTPSSSTTCGSRSGAAARCCAS